MTAREKQIKFRKAIRKVLCGISFVAVLCMFGYVSNEEFAEVQAKESKAEPNTYALTTIVTYVDKNAEEVICEDVNGFEWSFKGDDWELGDIAALTMCDNGTQKIFDDEVVSARYNGWIGLWEERFPQYVD